MCIKDKTDFVFLDMTLIKLVMYHLVLNFLKFAKNMYHKIINYHKVIFTEQKIAN